MHNLLVHLKVISLLSLFSCSSMYKTENTKEDDLIMMRACEEYITSYTPLYIVDEDTLAVARFNIVPDSINKYLIDCARKNDFKPLKYSAALIIRQHQEYLKVNDREYMLMEALTQKNGFIVLIRQAMKIGNIDDEFTNMDYFPIFSGDACKWINDNKGIIDDYKFVEMQRRKFK